MYGFCEYGTEPSDSNVTQCYELNAEQLLRG